MSGFFSSLKWKHVSGGHISSRAPFPRILGERCSQRQNLPSVDVQNLRGIWVHVPPLMICGLHSLWPPLRKSNIPPWVRMKLLPASHRTSSLRCPGSISNAPPPLSFPSSTLPKRKDPRGKKEKEAKPISHLDVVSFF